MSSTRDVVVAKWDKSLTPRAKRRRIEGLLKLGFRLGSELSMDAPAHRHVGSSLARHQPAARWPRSLSNSHSNFSSDVYMLLRHVDGERAQSIVAHRIRVEAGAARPLLAWSTIAGEHGISERQAERLYTKALDQIAAALDGLAGMAGIGS